mmetsp:Transcript_26803/g.78957  ORF Transcript_26803/g.78957 Transcript_26803/m.78957 type:complete len:477 (-) Transcript_26803:218-1648(-)
MEETGAGSPAAPSDGPLPRRTTGARVLMVMGPLYMLLGWVTFVVFLLLLGAATDGLKPDELLTSGVRWGAIFSPLWLRDIAGVILAVHLVKYRSVGTRAKVTAIEALLNVILSIAFKMALLLRLGTREGSIRLVCLPVYLSMLVGAAAQAIKSAATPVDQRASSHLGLGFGVSHLLAITVACKLDGVASYKDSTWLTTLWPLWLGLGFLAMGVIILACCFTPFLVCFSAAERRGPTERVLGPVMVMVTIFAVLGFSCALVGCVHIALWLDGDPTAMHTAHAFDLLAAAATCALLIGVCLAIIVVVQDYDAQEGDLNNEPAVSLEEMMNRAVKPKQLIRQSSTLYKRHETLLGSAPASDAPGFDDGAGEVGGRRSALSAGDAQVDPRIIAAYELDDDEDKDRMSEADVCWICEGGPREAVFLECGHGGVCYSCAEKCWNSQRRHGCPMCRQPVTQIVRVAGKPRTGKDGELIVDVLS